MRGAEHQLESLLQAESPPGGIFKYKHRMYLRVASTSLLLPSSAAFHKRASHEVGPAVWKWTDIATLPDIPTDSITEA